MVVWNPFSKYKGSSAFSAPNAVSPIKVTWNKETLLRFQTCLREHRHVNV
jgi:hypothetical protein